MIDYKFDQKSKTMEFIVGGKITAEEYDRVIQEFQRDLAENEGIKVLELVTDFKGIEPLALWKDIKFSISQFGTINSKLAKCAVVSNQKWIEMVTKTFDPLIKAEMKFFKVEQEGEARKWLAE